MYLWWHQKSHAGHCLCISYKTCINVSFKSCWTIVYIVVCETRTFKKIYFVKLCFSSVSVCVLVCVLVCGGGGVNLYNIILYIRFTVFNPIQLLHSSVLKWLIYNRYYCHFCFCISSEFNMGYSQFPNVAVYCGNVFVTWLITKPYKNIEKLGW